MALDFTKLYDGQSVREACEGMNTNLDKIDNAIEQLQNSSGGGSTGGTDQCVLRC